MAGLQAELGLREPGAIPQLSCPATVDFAAGLPAGDFKRDPSRTPDRACQAVPRRARWCARQGTPAKYAPRGRTSPRPHQPTAPPSHCRISPLAASAHCPTSPLAAPDSAAMPPRAGPKAERARVQLAGTGPSPANATGISMPTSAAKLQPVRRRSMPCVPCCCPSPCSQRSP